MSKMAPRRVVKTTNNYNNLQIKDVICPICRTILIEPITLPCHHSFCSSCFHVTIGDRINLLCSLCCVRIGSWLRTATKSNKLINETLWKTIKDLFPLQVRTKLDGVDENYKKNKHQDIKVSNNFTKAKRNLMDLVENKSKMDKTNNITLHNLNTKEYTCRILCHNIQQTNKTTTETNKRRVVGDENNRSNSIEPECLYFKPIDYRRNPPSEGQQPIKVPTKKPTINSNTNILAPCGQNQLNLNPIESAFAYYFLLTTTTPSIEKCKTKAVKRNNRTNYRNCKKLKINDNNNNMEFPTRNLRNRHELQKRLQQEKADFELAIKLQEAYNQSKYSTRSSVPKRATTKTF